MRIGVHLGDVLVRDKVNFNLAVGDAINIAARLQALAEPGTMCVSDGVYRHVREKRQEKYIDLGRQQLKNISDPVHAYLIVPREHAAAHRPRTRRRSVRVAGALLAVAAVAAIAFYRGPWWPAERPRAHVSAAKVEVMPVAGQYQPAQLVTLGVMGFRNVGGSGAEDWRCDALRDGINTQLSRLSQVKVYSKEFIVFLSTRKGLTEIEAASQLGIRKMVSGSVVTSKGAVQIELHVVDVDSGVLELSYDVRRRRRFLDLRNKLALDVIARLNLPVSDAERQVLLAQQTTDVEALRLLLEASTAAPADRRRRPTPNRAPGIPARSGGGSAASLLRRALRPRAQFAICSTAIAGRWKTMRSLRWRVSMSSSRPRFRSRMSATLRMCATCTSTSAIRTSPSSAMKPWSATRAPTTSSTPRTESS